MKSVVKSFLFLLLLFTTNNLNSQVCPILTTNGTGYNTQTTLPCGQLSDTVDAFFPVLKATSEYAVSQIPYYFEACSPLSQIQYPVFDTLGIGSFDNIWSNPIKLDTISSLNPQLFYFCFFGNKYDSCIIGSNGVISFDLTTTICPWDISLGGAIPNTNSPQNAIMSPWQDEFPNTTTQISYYVNGVAPCRSFVVNYTHIPINGNPDSITTHQIVLHETTNIIDINIEKKPAMGYAIEGIQNINGTSAYVVPNRNFPNTWGANNDSWRFTPDGPSVTDFRWYSTMPLVYLGNTPQIIVYPPASGAFKTYMAWVRYTDCNDTTVWTTSFQRRISPILNTNDSIIHIGCNQGIIQSTVTNQTPNTTLSINWQPSVSYSLLGGVITTDTIASGTYILTISDGVKCPLVDTIVISNQSSQLSLNIDSIITTCNNTSSIYTSVISSSPYTIFWSPIGVDTTALINIGNGEYIVSVTNGCSSIMDTIFVYAGQVDTTFYNLIICENDSLILPNGTVINSSGLYSYSLQNTYGCDSIILYNVITDSLSITNIDIDSIQCNNGLGSIYI